MFDGHGQYFWECLMVMDSVCGDVFGDGRWLWTVFLVMVGGHGQCFWEWSVIMDSVFGNVFGDGR